MVWSNVRLDAILEMRLSMLFQVCGVVALCLTRLVRAAAVERSGGGSCSSSRWSASASPAPSAAGTTRNSPFFAGGTMTALLIAHDHRQRRLRFRPRRPPSRILVDPAAVA